MFFLPPFLFSLYAFPQNTQTHTHSHTFIHALPSPGLPCSLSLCFRWCRCCGRLIEMRVGMTAPCISASLQSPALPSTSASGTAVVGTQSFLLCVVLLILVCLLLPWQIDCFSPHFSKALNPTYIFFLPFSSHLHLSFYSLFPVPLKTTPSLSRLPFFCPSLCLLPSISHVWWPHCFALLSSPLLFRPSCCILYIHLLPHDHVNLVFPLRSFWRNQSCFV